MRVILQLAAFGMVAVAVLVIAGCPGQPQASGEQDQISQSGNEQAAEPQDVSETIVKVGMDLLAELGYDTSSLEVISMEMSPLDYSLLWRVRIGDALGIVADLNINEKTLQFELLNSIQFHEGISARSNPGPDESFHERIAEALELEEKGYRFVAEKDAAWEYRKYTTWEEWEIAVSHVVIVVPSDKSVSILFDYGENELWQPVRINIDRDTAVSTAQSWLDNSDAAPSHVELIQFPNDPFDPTYFSIYWEVVFGDQTVHVNADDGSIMEDV